MQRRAATSLESSMQRGGQHRHQQQKRESGALEMSAEQSGEAIASRAACSVGDSTATSSRSGSQVHWKCLRSRAAKLSPREQHAAWGTAPPPAYEAGVRRTGLIRRTEQQICRLAGSSASWGRRRGRGAMGLEARAGWLVGNGACRVTQWVQVHHTPSGSVKGWGARLGRATRFPLDIDVADSRQRRKDRGDPVAKGAARPPSLALEGTTPMKRAVSDSPKRTESTSLPSPPAPVSTFQVAPRPSIPSLVSQEVQKEHRVAPSTP